jgi:hypothetical protein
MLNPEEKPLVTGAGREVAVLSKADLEAVVDWQTIRDLLRQVLAGNPLYILSAGLMLFGIYLVSVDPALDRQELAQMVFNFSALQAYELLLVLTAVVLARRAVWYDSTLLVGLEWAFMFVPFILLVQASLLGQPVARAVCAAGSALVIGRMWALRRYHRCLYLPPWLLVCGGVMLLANLFFPLHFRAVIELDNDAWGQASAGLWLLFMPALVALAFQLPAGCRRMSLAPRKTWLPLLLFGLWLVGTGVHLAAVDYVNSARFHAWQLVPGLYALAWVVWRRLDDFSATVSASVREGLLGVPVLVSLLALAYPGGFLLPVLCGANWLLLGRISRRHPEWRVAPHLAVGSAVLLLAGLPVSWLPVSLGHLGGGGWAGVVCLGMGVGYLLGSARMAAGLGAAVLVWFIHLLLAGPQGQAGGAALNGALFVLVVHAFQWLDADPRVRFWRPVVALAWGMHAVVWGAAGLDPAFNWVVAASGLAVLSLGILWRLRLGRWVSRLELGVAVVVLYAPLLTPGIVWLRGLPLGYLTVLAAFLMFGAGTGLALTKHRWNRSLAD